MGLISWLGRVTGVSQLRAALARPDVEPPKGGDIEGAYASAQSGGADDLYELADGLNANAANSPSVRKTIREKARNACENNGPVEGLVKRIARDMVGRVPRVRITADRRHRRATRAVERLFAAWAKEAGLGEKLRLMDRSKIVDGESFAVLVNNPDFEGVQLDLKLFEADQVATPFFTGFDRHAFDGGRTDERDNVAVWHFLDAHPGSDLSLGGTSKTDCPARRVIQWFEPRRAGQLRGVSDIASSLTVFGYIRRFALATVKAAEMAACMAGVMETDQEAPPPEEDEDGEAADPVPTPKVMDKVRIPSGSLLTLPHKWKASQLKPEHPTTNYGQFKGDLMTDGGAPLGAPRCVSVNSAADYNFSAAQLDTKVYHQMLAVVRHDFATRVLNRIFRAWMDEAAVRPGFLPADMPAEWGVEWFFDGFPSADPVRDATAEDIRLKNRTTNLSEIYAEWGQDWQEELEQLAEEIEFGRELGLDLAMSANGPAVKPQYNDAGEQVGVETAEAATAGGGVQNTALNGAQGDILKRFADDVIAGLYSAEGAAAMVGLIFPLIPPKQIAAAMTLVAKHKPPAPPAPQETTRA